MDEIAEMRYIVLGMLDSKGLLNEDMLMCVDIAFFIIKNPLKCFALICILLYCVWLYCV